MTTKFFIHKSDKIKNYKQKSHDAYKTFIRQIKKNSKIKLLLMFLKLN